jgi:hypothetical protein
LKMSEQLGLDPVLWDQPFDQTLQWGLLAPGSQLVKGPGLFPRIEAGDQAAP